MNNTHIIVALTTLLALASCQKESPSSATSDPKANASKEELPATTKADIPILPLTKGDHWIYEVTLTIPEGVRSENSPAETSSFERTRTFIGKVKPGGTRPETDCFEMTAKGAPTEREFVDISDDRVMMRGSAIVAATEMEPFWLEPGVLLVRAGLLGGESLPPVKFHDPKTGAERMRYIQIIGRETIEAADKSFDTIRILMTGTDGGFDLRRTIWFAPGYGIINEEKTRFINDKLVLREKVILKSFSVKKS